MITTIPSKVILPDLRSTLLSVIESGKACEHELTVDSESFLMRITPYLNEFGRPIGAMLMFIDLTDVKQIDISLKTSNTYLHAVLNNVFDGIIVADEKGNIESLNLAAEHIFGYRSDEAVGKNVHLLQPEPFKSEHDGYIERYLKTGQAKIIGIGREVTGKREDGSTFPMDLAVTEMRVHGQRKFVGIVRDLTLRKQKQPGE